MQKVDQFPDRTIRIDDQEFLYFGGTSYLGMNSLTSFQEILIEQIKNWGTAYGSSRSANVQLKVYEETEINLAKWIGAEDCLTVSSGMLAGNLVLECFTKKNISFYHYPQSHPAIVHQLSKPLFMDGQLHPELLTKSNEEVVITTDSIIAMNVKPICFDFLNDINSSKKITMVIDESHSLGLLGNEGQGIFTQLNGFNISKKILVSSMGKALGLTGGIIAGDSATINEIKEMDQFISASGSNPAYMATFPLANGLYNQQRQLLKVHLDYINYNLKPNPTYVFDKEYPVIYCLDEDIADDLYKHQILITRFKYPTYSTEMLRIVISASHTKDDIKKLITILNKHT